MALSAHSLSLQPDLWADPTPAAEARLGKLWLCAHFPRLAVEVLSPSSAHPLAVVEERKGRPSLYALSESARSFGLETGMALAAAYALCPSLSVHPRNEAAEQNALQQLAAIGLDFTPWVSLDEPHSLLLEIRASLNLFGGAESLRERLRQRLLEQGRQTAIAITPSPEASSLLARLGVETVVTESSALRSALGRVPVGALPLDDKIQLRLARTGIRRLTDLWRLPRDGLARRYGVALVRWLDALSGAEARVISQFHSPPCFSARRDMPMELERLDHFFPAIVQLAEEFARFLQTHDAAALGIILDLSHQSSPSTRLELSFRCGNRDVAHWLMLLREKLERSPLPAPVIAIRLHSAAIAPFEPERFDLFADRATQGGREWESVLEQLQARLGFGALQWLNWVEDYRPELAVRKDGLDAAALSKKDLSIKTSTFARPLWLLPEPLPMTGQALQMLSEPERIESGWWDGAAIRRDYFPASDRQGRKLWMFRDLNSAGRWYLHGLFG